MVKMEKGSDKRKKKVGRGGDNIVRKKDEEYTPLTKSQTPILEEIKGKSFFLPNQRNSSSYQKSETKARIANIMRTITMIRNIVGL